MKKDNTRTHTKMKVYHMSSTKTKSPNRVLINCIILYYEHHHGVEMVRHTTYGNRKNMNNFYTI